MAKGIFLGRTYTLGFQISLSRKNIITQPGFFLCVRITLLALSGQAPKRAAYAEKQLVYLFQLPSLTKIPRRFRVYRCYGERFSDRSSYKKQ
jgi:hypothetical protein